MPNIMTSPTTASPPIDWVYPTAGVGGSLYNKPFIVPTYPTDQDPPYMTWHMLDIWGYTNGTIVATKGVATGLVWAIFLYLLALTPIHKKTTPFHTFMLIGLVFALIQLMIELLSNITPGLNPSPAYNFLTQDNASGTWPLTFIATFATSQVAAWLAFTFAAICLWIQAQGLMTGIKVQNVAIYYAILGYLASTSVATLGSAMAYSITQIKIVTLSGGEMVLAMANSHVYQSIYLVIYAVCIASYSLISMLSVIHIILRRPKSVMQKTSTYASALNLVGLFCAQSAIVPCKCSYDGLS
jgi:hypothetical protein